MEVIPEKQSGAIGASPLSPAMVAATKGMDLEMKKADKVLNGAPFERHLGVEDLDPNFSGPPGYSPPTENIPFGLATQMAIAGYPIARLGWNGKGMFVYYVPAASYPAMTGVAKEFFGEDALVPYNPYFAIKNVNGTVSTWTASINDQLADDWYVVQRLKIDVSVPFDFLTAVELMRQDKKVGREHGIKGLSMGKRGEIVLNNERYYPTIADRDAKDWFIVDEKKTLTPSEEMAYCFVLDKAKKNKPLNFQEAHTLMEQGHIVLRAGTSRGIRIFEKTGDYMSAPAPYEVGHEPYQVTRTDISSKEWYLIK